MTEKRTEIKPELPYWAICYGTHTVNHDNEDELEEDGSYSSDMTSRYWLVEFDSATELEEYIANASVSAGESMGEFTFDVVRLYTSWEMHNYNVQDEEDAKKEEPEYNAFGSLVPESDVWVDDVETPSADEEEFVDQDMYGRLSTEEDEE